MYLTEQDRDLIRTNLLKFRPKRVLMQGPEGVKLELQNIADWIEDEFKVEIAVMNDPCFGACDIADYPAQLLKCDLLIHMGHSRFVAESRIPVIYVPFFSEFDFIPLLEKNLDALKPYKKIGITTTIQHVHEVGKVAKFLEKHGKIPVVNEKQPLRCEFPAQTLGCDATAAIVIQPKVDAFLHLASGKFHALGLVKKVHKPLLVFDPETESVFDLQTEKALMEKRFILKREKFKDAKKVAILVSTKIGQLNPNVFQIKKRLAKMGKKSWIFVQDFLSPDKLEGLNIDFLLNTACPRIADDNVYKQTIADISEVQDLMPRLDDSEETPQTQNFVEIK